MNLVLHEVGSMNFWSYILKSRAHVPVQKAPYGPISKVIEKPLSTERTLCAQRQLSRQKFIFLSLSNQVLTINTLWTHWESLTCEKQKIMRFCATENCSYENIRQFSHFVIGAILP